ncbi:hypothetical protein PR202_gb05634 [Eleusine coracana subsp. coracana]|uniref:Calcineurin B-like protein n=1 Tax=Eleusine coracana subsp. coracana TaxID=191504 RepID=A0AAV5E6V4_ELECO|nr:hypothetical protein PR202_gb05634 [Eleusine coracana subsp. coracana]
MGCLPTKHANRSPARETVALATETSFTVSEVEALYELFRKLSNSIVKDGQIHKEEFHLALFRSKKQNLFVDRVFDLFDQKRNGVIEFGEFVRSLSVFHPDAPEEQKIAFAFRLYDLRQTGFIERHETLCEKNSGDRDRGSFEEDEEWLKRWALMVSPSKNFLLLCVSSIMVQLKEMVLALLEESDLNITTDAVELIVDRTFDQADTKGDGKIDQEEWTEFARNNPYVLRNMSLPYLK